MSKFAKMALPVDRPQRMPIVHPVTRKPLCDKDGAQAYIDLLSVDSEAAQQHESVLRQRRLDARGRLKVTSAEMEDEAVALLVALTAGWYLLDLDGEPFGVEFSPENARELYRERGTRWLRDAVDEFIGDRANFSKASSIG